MESALRGTGMMATQNEAWEIARKALAAQQTGPSSSTSLKSTNNDMQVLAVTAPSPAMPFPQMMPSSAPYYQSYPMYNYGLDYSAYSHPYYQMSNGYVPYNYPQTPLNSYQPKLAAIPPPHPPIPTVSIPSCQPPPPPKSPFITEEKKEANCAPVMANNYLNSSSGTPKPQAGILNPYQSTNYYNQPNSIKEIKFSLPKKPMQVRNSVENTCEENKNQSIQSNNREYVMQRVALNNKPSKAYHTAPKEKSHVTNSRPQSAFKMLQSNQWPESLKNYVSRAFNQCVTDLDKDRVEIMLKGKITKAFSDGIISTKNWELEPFPSLMPSSSPKQLSQTPIKQSPTNAIANSQPVISKSFIPLEDNNKSSPVKPRHNYRYSPPGYRRKRSNSRSRSRSRSRSKSPRNSRGSWKKYPSSSSDSSSDDSSNQPISRGPCKTPKLLFKNGNRSPNKRGNIKSRIENVENNKYSNSFEGKKGKKKKPRGGIAMEVQMNSQDLQKRAARFHHDVVSPQKNKSMAINNFICNNDDNLEIDCNSFDIVGTSTNLEKKYLRLTSAPDPSTIRPLEILKESLKMIKEHWIQNQDYHYACGQLKSVRQDLTVQGIRDEFTVKVYETHARIALEKGDPHEFNQCQAQLKSLHSSIESSNELEFTAYRILYYIYTEDSTDFTALMARLSKEEKENEIISHALKISQCYDLNNYHKFFKLTENSPNMAGYLTNWFAPRMRKSALKILLKSYRPTLPVTYVSQELAFHSEDDCLAFLQEFSIIFSDTSKTKIDCKASCNLLP
ncbi:Leukocyte receptor cluster member 8 [Nymphon striatum]|nr:Leukocyte receptor cluster member 8 [Nymphon striatum]